jgi:hypothetical protein
MLYLRGERSVPGWRYSRYRLVPANRAGVQANRRRLPDPPSRGVSRPTERQLTSPCCCRGTLSSPPAFLDQEGTEGPRSDEEVVMTHNIARTSAIALGVAAFVSFSPFSARADTPAASNPAPASSAAAASTAPAPPARPASMAPAPSTASAPSLSEPATTPGWAEAGPHGPTVAQQNGARRYPTTTTRATMHGEAGIATIARTPSPRPRPEWLAASPI